MFFLHKTSANTIMNMLLLGYVDQEMRDVEDTNRNTTNDYCVKRLEPVIGMEFDNEDIAYEFYNRYAGDICFSIRKFWHNKSLTNVICTKEFVCSREGFNKRNPSDACQ